MSKVNYYTTLTDPNIKFEVGEKVVITGASYPRFSLSDKMYADEDDFCFSTIEKVLDDGSVITKEGIKFKQAKRKLYGVLEYYQYFKSTSTKALTLKHKHYRIDDYGNCTTEKTFYSWDGENVYLFKCDAAWEKKAKKVNKKAKELREEKAIIEKHQSAKQVFRDAYDKEVNPLEEELWRKKVELWKKHMCANCMHNRNGYCKQWKETLETYSVSGCSAFDIEEKE